MHARRIEEPQVRVVEQSGRRVREVTAEELGAHGGVRHVGERDHHMTSIREEIEGAAQHSQRILEVFEDVEEENDVETATECSLEVQLLDVTDDDVLAPFLGGRRGLGVVFDAPDPTADLAQHSGHRAVGGTDVEDVASRRDGCYGERVGIVDVAQVYMCRIAKRITHARPPLRRSRARTFWRPPTAVDIPRRS